MIWLQTHDGFGTPTFSGKPETAQAKLFSVRMSGEELAYVDSNSKPHCPRGVSRGRCLAAFMQSFPLGTINTDELVMDK